MRAAYVATAAAMIARELARKRLVLVLALCVPVAFFAVAFATESNQLVRVVFASAPERARLVEELDLSLLFLSVAATSLISAFFAASLIQRQLDANRRLVLCGFRASELVTARLAVLLGIIAAATLQAGLSLELLGRLDLFTSPRFPAGMILGIAAGAFVYGCYGMLVGTLFRRELESIFAIVLVINVDAGWLQNPFYYGNSGSKWLIEALPAHFPSQVAYLSAFTSERIGEALASGLAYGALLLLISLALYARRMEVTR
jgi:hypothetical protein